jgi:hypothetical protein
VLCWKESGKYYKKVIFTISSIRTYSAIHIDEYRIKLKAYVYDNMDIRTDILLVRDLIQNWVIDGGRNCIILDNGFVVKMKNWI